MGEVLYLRAGFSVLLTKELVSPGEVKCLTLRSAPLRWSPAVHSHSSLQRHMPIQTLRTLLIFKNINCFGLICFRSDFFFFFWLVFCFFFSFKDGDYFYACIEQWEFSLLRNKDNSISAYFQLSSHGWRIFYNISLFGLP